MPLPTYKLEITLKLITIATLVLIAIVIPAWAYKRVVKIGYDQCLIDLKQDADKEQTRLDDNMKDHVDRQGTREQVIADTIKADTASTNRDAITIERIQADAISKYKATQQHILSQNRTPPTPEECGCTPGVVNPGILHVLQQAEADHNRSLRDAAKPH